MAPVSAQSSALATPPSSKEQQALALLDWTRCNYGKDVILTSSFGADSAVMLHLATQVMPDIPVVFIDTGYLFPETYRFVERLKHRFQLDLRVYTPGLTSAALEAIYGPLWEGDEDDLKHYQQLVKVEPMQRALKELKPKAWIAGVRAEQTETRASLSPIEKRDSIDKISPLLDWTEADIANYLERHQLPRHPLVELGYRSIGDVHSTTVSQPGNARSGRRLGAKKECGIHLIP